MNHPHTTSLFANGLIWFGAALSLMEILLGTLLAPLGFTLGMTAILLGHLIGCTLLCLAGLAGARQRLTSMETVMLSFGAQGSLFFSLLHVLRLVGWTALGILSAASAAQAVMDLGGIRVWCLVIGGLLALWTVMGLHNWIRLNWFVMTGLFLLTLVLSAEVFSGLPKILANDSISFSMGVEISAATPLFWIPMISDYTSRARKPFEAACVSSADYFLTSCWMYAIGLGASLYTGASEVFQIMLNSYWLRTIGLTPGIYMQAADIAEIMASSDTLAVVTAVMVVFSAATTLCLCVHSAGVSSHSVSERLREKPASLAVCAAGTALAFFTPVALDQYEDLLYLINSMSVPMIAVVLTDVFILKADHSWERANLKNFLIWLAGFGLYHCLLALADDPPFGKALPVLLATSALCVAAGKLQRRFSVQ